MACENTELAYNSTGDVWEHSLIAGKSNIQ